jgi:large subunit ribosomal protein L13
MTSTLSVKTYEIDATEQSLGRLASGIAVLLRGKNSPSYMPELSPKITVIVRNLDKIKFTGRKLKTKLYHRYSGYPGGLYTRTLEEMWKRSPQEVLRKSVYRMLPTNRQRDKIIKNLIIK